MRCGRLLLNESKNSSEEEGEDEEEGDWRERAGLTEEREIESLREEITL